MPLETATFIHELDATQPEATDPLAIADDSIRLTKSALKATFPNVKGEVTGSHTTMNRATDAFGSKNVLTISNDGTVAAGFLNVLGVTGTGRVALTATGTAGSDGVAELRLRDKTDTTSKAVMALDYAGNVAALASLDAPSVRQDGSELIPPGVIVMWSGSVGSIPAGWALCDGGGGRPNLRDKFIVGAGSAYSPGATGGAATTSGTTDAGGAHSHALFLVGGHGGTLVERGSGGGFLETVTDTEAAHTHAISGLAILPPYYALCYIIKT